MKIKFIYLLPVFIAVFFAGYGVNSQTLKGFIGEKYTKKEFSSVENKTAGTPYTTNKGTTKPKNTKIDINPPKLDEIDLSKERLLTGEKFTIIIKSEKNLLEAKAIINGQNYQLPALEWLSTIYYNTVNAPLQAGQWPIKIQLTDDFGNELIVDQAATIEVEAIDTRYEFESYGD